MGQPLQQGAALAQGPGARLVGLRAGVGGDADLIGLEGIPVDESAVMVFDEHLPFALRQLVAAHPQRPVGIDAAALAGAAEHVGTRIRGVGEHIVHRVIGRLDPGDLAAVQQILGAAGFGAIAFTDVHEPVYYGPDVAVALDWVRGFTCTSEALKPLDPAAAARAVGRLREALTAHLSDDGVWFNSRAWIITARRH